MKCIACGHEYAPKKSVKNPNRLPQNWHRDPAGNPHCKACWSNAYILRAITFRVTGPQDGDWAALRESLKTCWQSSTRVANWAIRECAKADVVRTPDMEKLPNMPKIYLYGLARKQGFDLGCDSQSAAGVLRMAEQRYRAQRLDAVWFGKVSNANFRYPTPYPIHNASWSLAIEQERLVLSVRLAGERGKLILAGGSGFRRQRKAAEQLIAGLAIAGEAAIYERRSHSGDHRNGTKGRDSGGQKASSMVMAKLAMWLPRDESRERDGTLFVRTDIDALLVALNAKDERLWIYNGDHISRWVAEHSRRLNRWSDDTKAENRPPRFQSRREAAVRKYRNRLDSATHEISSQVVGYASRRGFAVICYDDTDRRYTDRFLYFELKTRLAEKANEAGIVFECSSDAKPTGSPRSNASAGERT